MAKERLEDEYPVSDKEMVQKAIKQHEEKEVRDYKFPTEIIDLPSKGLSWSGADLLNSFLLSFLAFASSITALSSFEE